MSHDSIGIVGAGNSAHALAAYLSNQGHRITLYARDKTKLEGLVTNKGFITAEGQVNGSFPVDCITDDFAVFGARVGVIFLATVTTAYVDVIQALAPFLKKHHIIVAFSSKLLGSQEVARTLEGAGVRDVPVIETDALFACRLREPGTIWIRGIKQWNIYSCPTRSQTLEFGTLLTRYFPWLKPADHVIQRGLTDFGALAHAVITLANISRIDRQDEFLFYYEGLSPRTVVLLESMEQEFKNIAAAYETEIPDMKDLLNRYYGCDTSSLLQAMATVPNYRHSLAPKTLDHRYLQEDVACTLVPLRQLAAKAFLKTPMLDTVIHLASLLSGKDFAIEGRSLPRLGLGDLTRKELVQWMVS